MDDMIARVSRTSNNAGKRDNLKTAEFSTIDLGLDKWHDDLSQLIVFSIYTYNL